MAPAYKNKIAVCLMYLSHKDSTGGFIYTENLLRNMFLLDKESGYFLFIRQNEYRYFNRKYGQFPNVELVIIDIKKDLWKNPLIALKKILAKYKKDGSAMEAIILKQIQTFIHTNGISVFFSPLQTLYPKGIRDVFRVQTIYDIQHAYMPQNFTERAVRQKNENDVYAIQNAEKIIAISEYTKKCIVETYKIDPEKVTVTHLAPNIADQTKKIDLPKRFLFYPAALWPHKNHKTVIIALSMLKEKFTDLHFVSTGVTKDIGFKNEITDIVRQCGLEEKIHFLGFIDKEEMAYVYQKATCLVFPSFFEGFAMPILEAFHYNVPVIGADNSSIIEIMGNAGMASKTGDSSDLAQKIALALSDENLRRNMVERGKERIKLFSWEKTAKKTLTFLLPAQKE